MRDLLLGSLILMASASSLPAQAVPATVANLPPVPDVSPEVLPQTTDGAFRDKDCCSTCTSEANPTRYWVESEYLLWWMKRGPLSTPIVTTDPNNGTPLQRVAWPTGRRRCCWAAPVSVPVPSPVAGSVPASPGRMASASKGAASCSPPRHGTQRWPPIAMGVRSCSAPSSTSIRVTRMPAVSRPFRACWRAACNSTAEPNCGVLTVCYRRLCSVPTTTD